MKRRRFLKTTIAAGAAQLVPGGLNKLLADPRYESTAPALPKLDATQIPELRNLTAIYVVSPNGNDQNPGTPEMPFRTVSQAARILQPGEGVLVRAGTYRERVSPERGGEPGRPIVYFAEPGYQVFIKGSDVWQPAWTKSENRLFSAIPDEKMFTDDVYRDSANPLRVAVSATPWQREGRAEYEYFSKASNVERLNSPDRLHEAASLVKKCDKNLVFTLGQVFVDGKMFRQMPYLSEMEASPESWFYDSTSSQVFVHFGDERAPNEHQVELTTRRRIFAPHLRGLGYIHVIGFVMEHCGNQYPTDFWNTPQNSQAGAIGARSGNHWSIQNNVIRFANAFGMDIGAEGQGNERGDETRPIPEGAGFHSISNNLVTDNGAGGICGLQPRGVHIIGNVIERNNSLRFKGAKRWESAGVKLHRPDDGLVANNLFLNNYTYGFWCDSGIGMGLRFTRNVIVGDNESEHGVFIETGAYGPDTGFVENNILFGNRNGFYCHDGSGVTVSHNLIANSREYGIQVRQVSLRCNTRNNSFYSNLLIGNANAADLNFPAELGGKVRLDANVYSGDEVDRTFVINKYSKFNPEWTDQEFDSMVEAVLKPKTLDRAAYSANGLVKLNFAEWRQFWSHYSVDADAQSRLTHSATVSLNPETLELVLIAPDATIRCRDDDHFLPKLDFLGNAVPRTGVVVAGPFQNIHRGTFRLKLRNSLQSNVSIQGN